jgi:hypothetical protein
MHTVAPEVVSIADACLGGLQGRSALLIGSEEQRYPYMRILRQARMKHVYQEDTPLRVSYLLPYVQLLISASSPCNVEDGSPILKAATIAKGCEGRHTPLLIFDIAHSPSVEELAGLLPAVCLYTPDDLRHILQKIEMKAS